MRGFSLVAAGCLAAFSVCAATEEPVPAEAVQLQFGWTPGTVAQIETTRQRVRVTGDKQTTTTASTRYRMQVEPHEEGLLITYKDFDVPTNGGTDEARIAGAEALMQKLSAVMPSFVVSPQAELLRLENVSELREQMRTVFEPMLAEMKDAPPQLYALMRSALSDEALTAGAVQEWNALVGAWAGGALEPQAVYAQEAEEPLPMFPGQTVPMRYEFSLLETIPCTNATDGPQCVVLEMQSSPEPEAMKKLLEGFMQQVTPESTRVVFDRLDINSSVVVVMEPGTMLPYRLQINKRVEGTAHAPGEDPQAVSQVDERISTFTYLK